jgi:hypothetical protein
VGPCSLNGLFDGQTDVKDLLDDINHRGGRTMPKNDVINLYSYISKILI